MKRLSMMIAIAAAVVLAAPAQAQDVNFKVFGAAGYVSPLSDENVTIGSVTDSIQAASQAGWNVGFEWRMTKLLGLEFDYLNATHDIEFGDATIGETTFQPISATLNFHLVHTKVVDFYLGPTASYVDWGNIDRNDGGSIPIDGEFAYGGSIGLDIGLGKSFAIIGGVRYLVVDLTATDAGTVDSVAVNPLVSRLGVAFRW